LEAVDWGAGKDMKVAVTLHMPHEH
jgi:hypothetical protein